MRDRFRSLVLVLGVAVFGVACGDNAASSDGPGLDTAPSADARVDSGGNPDSDPGVLEIVVTPTTVALEEGGTPGRFSVSLSQAPPAAVTLTVGSSDAELVPVAPTTLTFTPENFATAQDVGVGAEHDADLDDESITVTVSGEGLTSRTVEVTVTDDDTQTIVVEPTDLDVTEGLTTSIGVSLGYAPAANVTVTVTSSDVTGATVSPATLTFTPANYATPQAVAIAGVQDADTVDDSVSVSVASAGLTTVAVAVTVVDEDSLNISATPATVPLTEGGATGSIAVTLTQQPAANVTVNVATADAGAASISTTALTFTPVNYAVAQNVVVTAVQDGDVMDEATTVTLSATGLTSRTVNVTVDDDDVQAIVVSANATAGLTVAEGGTVTFTAALQFNPGADTTVAVASSDLSAIGAAPVTLVFTAANFAVPQTVTVSGVQDVDLTNEAGTLTLQATGIGPTVVNVAVTDNDTQTIVAAPSPASVVEGGMSPLGVHLGFQPAAPVTVTVATSDATTVAISTTTLTFTPANYAVDQTVNLMGVNDADLVNDVAQITLSATGVTSVQVTTTVQDDDSQNILANPGSATLTEGGLSSTIGVSLSFMPAADVTVTVVSSDPGAATASPASFTFTPANYNVPQNLTVAPATDADARNEALTVALSATDIPSTNLNVTVADDDVQALVVAPLTVAVTEQGAAGSFSVSLAAEPNDTRTITITSNDPGAVATSTATLTFTTLDWMTPQQVNVSGVTDPDLADEATTVTVAAAPGFSSPVASVNVDVTVDDDDGQSIVVAPDTVNVTEDTPSGDDQFSVSLAFQPAGNVSVTVTSANPAAASVSPGTLTFTPANYATPQLVSVSGVSDANQTNTSTTINVASTGLTTQVVAVNVIDDDEQTIMVEPAIVGAGENTTTQSFTVRLAYEPLGGTETITLASQAPTEVGISTTTMTFVAGDYATLRTVTVSPQEDADVLNEEVTIDLTSNRVSTPANFVLVQVTDNDSQQILRDPAQFTIYEDGDGNDSGSISIHLQQDPSGTLAVTTTSLDPGAAAVSAGATLSFTTANYLADQLATITAVSDVDLADETVEIQHDASGIPTQTTSVIVEDDDTQAIVLSTGTVDVVEEATATFTVALAFQPAANRSITVTPTSAAVATASPGTLVFTPENWMTPQTVTVTGTTDANLDPDSTTLTVAMLGGLVAPEGATSALVTVNVADNDEQSIIVTTTDSRLQEEGPGRTYTVHLEFPPALANGGSDFVEIFSTTGYLSHDADGGGLFFDTTNFSVPQSVTVYAPGDDDELSSEDTVRHVINSYTYLPTTDHVFGITDDEIAVLAEATITSLNDGTEFTKRSNVRANPAGGLVVTGLDSGGDIAGGSITRDLTGFALVNGGAAYADPGADFSPIFAAEHDGTDYGFFSTEGTNVGFTRLATDLASVAVTSTFAGRDFWPTWNGTTYGVVARHAANNNLFFRTLNPSTGTFGSPIQVTTSSPTPHEHPNLHAVGGGWVTIYSSAAEVRCVVMAANGAPTLNVAMAGYPTGGAYVSSIYNPEINRIVTAHVDPTRGIYVNEIDPGDCVVTQTRRARQADNYITVPSIGFNGTEYLVAYDVVTDTGNQVGVVRINSLLGGDREDVRGVVVNAQRPSLDWAGDRWVVRAALDGGGIQLVGGSFQTYCTNGVMDEDETAIDCGGPTCGVCAAEFGFTDTSGDDVATTELLDFFAESQPGMEWLFVNFITPGSGSGQQGISYCLHDAETYAANYVAFATTSTNFCGGPDPENYYRSFGSTTWNGPSTSCTGQTYVGNAGWGTGDYSLGIDVGFASSSYTFIRPQLTDGCELYDVGWGDCQTGSSVELRMGFDRMTVCGF